MNVVAVSDEPQVRALAISAGLPAYDSIAGAEQALATFREQDRRISDRADQPDDAARASWPSASGDPSATRGACRCRSRLPSVAARRLRL